MKKYKSNAIIIGALFIITMIAGMVDAYFVSPKLKTPITEVLHCDTELLIGTFSVLIMAIGIVFIAIAFYPVIKKQNETIALTYVVFRTIESLLLLLGPICYLYILALGDQFVNAKDPSFYFVASTLAIKTKYIGYQLAMIVLGFGSLFLCYSLYQSKYVPKFLSIWGGVGYFLLLLSAVLDICGVVNTTSGLGTLLYIPGGLWEFIVFPFWLFIKGFYVVEDLT